MSEDQKPVAPAETTATSENASQPGTARGSSNTDYAAFE